LRVVAFGLALVAAGRVTAAADPREMKAREEFGAGRYDAALEIFAKLYAETLHPTYLRNVARCYQNLGQPERAITSFREYLRKAKHITADERAEVEDYIKEMEALKKQQDEAAAAKPVAPVTPLPAATPPPEPKQPTSAPTLVAQPTPESERHEASPSIFGRWWFWAAVAGAVGVGVGVAAAAGAFAHTQADPTCTGDIKCFH
jgi:tetratricopeptide (TPR) repeat protein